MPTAIMWKPSNIGIWSVFAKLKPDGYTVIDGLEKLAFYKATYPHYQFALLVE